MIFLLGFIGLVGAAWYRRNRKNVWASLGAAAILGGGITATVVLGSDTPQKVQIPSPPPNPIITTLSLLASRDMGRLSARGTADGQWCGAFASVGLATPAHCWQSGASGTISDVGSTGGWDLTAIGTPRYSIVTGLSVESSGTVDTTSEVAAGLDGAAYYSAGSQTTAAATLSISFVAAPKVNVALTRIWAHRSVASGIGAEVALYADGRIWVGAGGVVSTTGAILSTDYGFVDNTSHCYTVVIDASVANGVRFFRDGFDYTPTANDISGVGDMSTSATMVWFARENGTTKTVGLWSRGRYDTSALTQQKHRAICRSWGMPVDSSSAIYSAIDWHQTGSTRCLQTSAQGATCFGGSLPAYYWDGAAIRPAEEPARTNRILYSWAPVCVTGWTCTTATIAVAVSPAGLKSAGAITMSGGTVDVAGTGYTGNAAVYPSVWVSCSSGTLTIMHEGGTGTGSINCDALAGAWTLWRGTGWTATAGGVVTMRFSGTNATVWLPTVTEVVGLSSIPTMASAVTVGGGALVIPNPSGLLWASGDTVTVDSVEGAVPCWITGNPLRLSGNALATCSGGISSLLVSGTHAALPAHKTVLVILAGQSNADGRALAATIPAPWADLPTDSEYYNSGTQKAAFGTGTYWGLEAPIANIVDDARPLKTVIVVKRALSGVSLYCLWRPGGCDAGRCTTTSESCANYQYDLAIADVARSLGSRIPDEVVLVWFQGETDASVSQAVADDYAAGFAAMVAQLEIDIGHQIDHIVIPRVYCSAGCSYLATVQAAQDAAAVGVAGATVSVIDTDAMSRGDAMHLDGTGMTTCGNAVGADILSSISP